MSSELLFRKLNRLKHLATVVESYDREAARKLHKAVELLSDPTTHLDIPPRETLNGCITELKRSFVSTSSINRNFLETMIHNDMKDDIALVRKKMSNLDTSTVDNLINAAAAMKTLRKVLSGVSTELLIRESR